MSRPAPKPPDIIDILKALQRDVSSLRQEIRSLQEQQRHMLLDLQRTILQSGPHAMPQVSMPPPHAVQKDPTPRYTYSQALSRQSHHAGDSSSQASFMSKSRHAGDSSSQYASAPNQSRHSRDQFAPASAMSKASPMPSRSRHAGDFPSRPLSMPSRSRHAGDSPSQSASAMLNATSHDSRIQERVLEKKATQPLVSQNPSSNVPSAGDL